jgi:hypothetical protein
MSCFILTRGAQENVRGTCDQVRARVAIELRVLKFTCVPFAIQLRYSCAFASILGKPV